MLVGILSDIHDQLDNLRKALNVFDRRQVATVLFCGDFCSPIPIRIFGEFSGRVHCVFGNGDGDRFTMLKLVQEYPSISLHGEYAEIEIDGVKIALTHYPLYGKALARTGDYRAVFSGHTHSSSQEHIGDCLWLNPGDVMGWKNPPTCAIYDTHSHQAEIVTL